MGNGKERKTNENVKKNAASNVRKEEDEEENPRETRDVASTSNFFTIRYFEVGSEARPLIALIFLVRNRVSAEESAQGRPGGRARATVCRQAGGGSNATPTRKTQKRRRRARPPPLGIH